MGWLRLSLAEAETEKTPSSTHVNKENWTENHVKLNRTVYQSTSIVWHANPELRLCNLKAKLKRKWMPQMVVLETDNQLFFSQIRHIWQYSQYWQSFLNNSQWQKVTSSEIWSNNLWFISILRHVTVRRIFKVTLINALIDFLNLDDDSTIWFSTTRLL